MKLELHVHTTFSGRTTIYPLSLILKEERFNQSLRFDLVARPAASLPEAAQP